MKLPDWRTLDLDQGVLCQAAPADQRLVVWLPLGSEGNVRYWERISSVSGTEVTTAHGLCAIAATSMRATQRVRGFFGKMLGRSGKPAADQTWVLPNGETAQPQGERRTDLLLVWSDDENAVLEESQVRSCWPEAKRLVRLGRNLFLVGGAQRPAVANEPSLMQMSPREQAEHALAAARQSGDRRRQALALADLGVVCEQAGEAPRAVALLQEALALADQLGDRDLEGDVLGSLGLAVLGTGDVGRCLELLQQALTHARATGNRFGEKTALERLGTASACLRDPGRALALYEQAMALAHAVGDQQHEAELLWQQAIQHAELSQRDQAVAKGQAAVDLLEKRNHPHARWFADHLHKYRTGAADAVPPARGATFSVAEITDRLWAPQTGQQRSQGEAAGPGLLRMAFSAAKSMAKFVGSGMQTVSAEVHRQRLETCAACPHHTGVRCRICGCFTNLKARLPHERCPIGKWPV